MEREVKFTPDEAPSMEKFNEKFNELLKLSAPAGYREGTKQDGVKELYQCSAKKGWFRVATTNYHYSSCIFSLHHGWSSGGFSSLVCLVDANANNKTVKCLEYSGLEQDKSVPVVSNVRVVKVGGGVYAIDVYNQFAASNWWGMNVIDTGCYAESQWLLQDPVFIAVDDTLPEGETLQAVMAWQNPPMVPGVEYRTTERHNGKPVYVKAVSLGSMPSAEGFSNGKTVNLNISDLADVVRWSGIASGLDSGGIFTLTLPVATVNGRGVALSAYIYKGIVYIEADKDRSALVGTATVWYTKTTD